MCVAEGCRHIDDGPATPQADLFHVSPDHRRSVFTEWTHPDRLFQAPTPFLLCRPNPEPVALTGTTQGQRLGINLEVVVPELVSDLTDGCRADGRYDERS